MLENLVVTTPEQLETFIRAAVRSELAAFPVSTNTKHETDEIGSISDAARWSGYAVPTIYDRVSRRKFPHFKQAGKLFFSKTEILNWIKSGKRKTVAEITATVN